MSNILTSPKISKYSFRIIQAVKVPSGSAFRKMDEDLRFFITHNGIEMLPGERPDAYQVRHCEEWIKRFARPRKTINLDISGYGLKHVVEQWSFEGEVWPGRGYCTNGSFIEAALNLGYKFLPAGWGRNPNAYFNMRLKKYRKSRYDYRFSYVPWDDETEETYVLEYSASHHARGLFPLHVSDKKKSDRRGPGPGCWKVIDSGTQDEMFAALEAKAKEMGVK